jgi:hypothetical protein
MRNLINRAGLFVAQRRAATVAAITTATVATTAGQALAVPAYDLTPISTGFTDQVQSALTVGLPIAAGLIALSVGLAWVRKLLKSK